MIEYNLRMIDSIGVNERTIVSWFDTNDKSFNFGIFHLTEQPNYISKLSGITEYGYLTYVGSPLVDYIEAADVYSLFLEDLINFNNWWEDDTNIYISEKMRRDLDEKFGVDKAKISDIVAKPSLRLIKGGE